MSISGRNTKWGHGTNALPTTIVDYTGKMREVGMEMEADDVDATVFGSGYKSYEQSFKECTFNTTYKFDPATYSALALLWTNGTVVSFEYLPDGTGSGKPTVTGSAVMTSFSMDTGIGDLLEVEVEWRTNGAVVIASLV